MPLPPRKHKLFKLAAEDAERLRRVTHRRGMTEQAFFQAAMVRAIDEADAEDHARKDARARRREERDARRFDEPQGLFPDRRPRVFPEPSSPPAVPQGVVVNVSGPASGGDLVARLAAKVAAAPERERDNLLRQAEDLLDTDEERRALAGQLETAVKDRVAEKRSSGLVDNLLRGIGLDVDDLYGPSWGPNP